MKDELDLYLTSTDWITFIASKQLTKIRRIRKGLFTYYLVTTKDTIDFDHGCNEFLATTFYHYVNKNIEKQLLKPLDVYIADRSEDGNIKLGKLIARDTYLHKRDQ